MFLLPQKIGQLTVVFYRLMMAHGSWNNTSQLQCESLVTISAVRAQTGCSVCKFLIPLPYYCTTF